ncbi:MAG TPA: putative sulfate exporter family transporter [Longimicrobiaceae bacterium]|nr:putative sulfate exporter family transporter [Longimicrobiaceae bacterium]
MLARKTVFVVLLLISMSGFISAPVALAIGIAMGLLLENPWPEKTARAGKSLLKISVIGLGFGIAITQVWEVGRSGIIYTIIGIAFTLLLGRLLGRVLRVPENTTALVSFGTAICGGSAIAAMAPVIDADDEEIAASLATVFTLNAVALFIFPRIGELLELSQREFGLWAALAIHDTSSVVAAGAVYGSTALAIATTVKLARAVWIAPIALGTAWLRRSKGRVAIPWFIAGFLLASVLRAVLPQYMPAWDLLAAVARQALVVTLFLIGTGMTRSVIAAVGPRPLILGVVLWVVVAGTTLALIAGAVIR